MISDVGYRYPTSNTDIGHRISYPTSDIDIGRRISYRTSDIISDYSSVEGHAVAVIVSQTAPHIKSLK